MVVLQLPRIPSLFALFILHVSYTTCYSTTVHSREDKTTHARLDGNVIIGGLVAVHDAGGQNNVHCKSDITSYGIQRVEAMRYAVAKVNERWKGTGLKLGINIRDSCGSETRALDESLKFVANRVPVCKNNDTVPMFGVVGASMSLLTSAVANLLRLFQIPLISYAATSTELSDTTKYGYLLRTVPPDSFQSQAMVDFIVDTLKWESVFIIYSVGSYGEYGYESFVNAAGKKKNKSLCIVDQKKVRPGVSQEEMENILNYFKKDYPNVTGIVCYCEIPDVKTLFRSITSLDLEDRITLIGSDSTLSGTNTSNSFIFSLQYNYSSVKNFYEKWYNQLTPRNFEGSNRTLNPWFQDFWNDTCWQTKRENPNLLINCSNDDMFGLCRTSPMNTLRLTCQKDDKIPYTIDAVFAFAHAIEYVWTSKFKNRTSDLLHVELKNITFLEDLQSVNFEGFSGNVNFNTTVMRGSYDINQYNVRKKTFEVIGRWNDGTLNILPGYLSALQEEFSESTCQEKCGPGQRKISQSRKCCWTCDPCKFNHYLDDNNTCIPCDESERPILPALNGCQKLEVRHFFIQGKIAIAVLAIIGVILTLYVIKTFIANNGTPLVKATGRELTYIQLIGILLLFCMPVAFIPRPTEQLCGIARVSFGILICLCYSSLLVKTNRIARILTGRQNLQFLTPNWQVIFTAFLTIPQILICIIGIMFEPKSRTEKFEDHLDYGVEMCKPYTKDTIATIAYNLMLVFSCTFYAFRTRKAPANFNEARYIGFVMYTTIVIWLTFLPVYFWTDLEYNTVFLLVIMVAMTLLVGLFGMKMYILVYRKDKNTMKSSKLRPVAVTSSKENSDGGRYKQMQMPSPRNVHFQKTVTDSTLVLPDSLPSEIGEFGMSESSFTCNRSTLKIDRGTSTSDDRADDSGISESSDEVFHEPLHKTMTL